MLIKYSLWLFIEPERGGLVADSLAGGEADWGCGMGGGWFCLLVKLYKVDIRNIFVKYHWCINMKLNYRPVMGKGGGGGKVLDLVKWK